MNIRVINAPGKTDRYHLVVACGGKITVKTNRNKGYTASQVGQASLKLVRGAL